MGTRTTLCKARGALLQSGWGVREGYGLKAAVGQQRRRAVPCRAMQAVAHLTRPYAAESAWAWPSRGRPARCRPLKTAGAAAVSTCGTIFKLFTEHKFDTRTCTPPLPSCCSRLPEAGFGSRGAATSAAKRPCKAVVKAVVNESVDSGRLSACYCGYVGLELSSHLAALKFSSAPTHRETPYGA